MNEPNSPIIVFIRTVLEHTLTSLIILKIVGHIDWSWWWVFSPLWVPTGLAIIFLALAVVIASMGETDK